MLTHLELLAPARNIDIGIAAIDCGADAVYVAGPAFGARKAAGNSMEDIRRLTGYAHRFGVRIFLTLNTILFDSELKEAERILAEAKAAGVDAVIAQDLAVWKLTDLPVHASTQCAIRTPEKARLYENLGTERLVLERELSLERIKAIRSAVGCELEFFVHGALCVCYSGQCYLSEQIAGRSANRGECIQACRSLYDLVDGDGRTLVRNKALLSLKDYNLSGRLDDLADAGICSFKIEGRLKNISYVRNTVRAYSSALDELVASNPEKYSRASFGRVTGGFTPDLGKTFNRGYTSLFLDGERSRGWSSMDAPKSIGEEVGTVMSIAPAGSSRPDSPAGRIPAGRFSAGRPSDRPVAGGENITITVRMKSAAEQLRNGDGFSFLAKGGSEIIGFRGDVCQGCRITCRPVPGLYAGAKLYRNLDTAFEKELESNLPVRMIPVRVGITVSMRNAGIERGGDERTAETGGDNLDGKPQENAFLLTVKAVSQDGRSVGFEREAGTSAAENPERMRNMFTSQLSKSTGTYSFTLSSLDAEESGGALPFLPASTLNAIRRDIAAELENLPCGGRTDDNAGCKARISAEATAKDPSAAQAEASAKDSADAKGRSALEDIPDIQKSKVPLGLSYKANISNRIAKETYLSLGAEEADEAFELSHRPDAELMRTKYCVRYELGLCPVHQKAARNASLFLVNNGKHYALSFDCKNCEMTVRLPLEK
jgi:23S rRNA 5-hydroxycytidine C2501 synthase